MMFHKRFHLVVLQTFNTCTVNRDVGTCRCKGGTLGPHLNFTRKKTKPVSFNEWAFILQLPPDIQTFLRPW